MKRFLEFAATVPIRFLGFQRANGGVYFPGQVFDELKAALESGDLVYGSWRHDRVDPSETEPDQIYTICKMLALVGAESYPILSSQAVVGGVYFAATSEAIDRASKGQLPRASYVVSGRSVPSVINGIYEAQRLLNQIKKVR